MQVDAETYLGPRLTNQMHLFPVGSSAVAPTAGTPSIISANGLPIVKPCSSSMWFALRSIRSASTSSLENVALTSKTVAEPAADGRAFVTCNTLADESKRVSQPS